MKKAAFVCILFYVLSLGIVSAQDGSWDTNYGTLGYVYPAGGGSNDYLKSVIVQPDGNVLVGGSAYFALANKRKFYFNRYTSSGGQDPNFNSGAPLLTQSALDSNNLGGMALQLDGSIVFGGYAGSPYRATAGKLKSNGTPLIAPITPFFIYPSTFYNHFMNAFSYNRSTGATVLGGYIPITSNYGEIAKLDNNLVLVSQFGTNGKLDMSSTLPIFSNCTAVESLDNGYTLLAGTSSFGGVTSVFTVVKLRPNGGVDPNFNTTGVSQVIVSPGIPCVPQTMKVLPDGSILVAGSTSGDMALIKLTSTGALDTNFPKFVYDMGGTEVINSISIQPDKKILLVGTSSSGILTGFVMRLNANGTVDTDFGANGVTTIPNIELKGSDISTKDNMLYVVGKSYPLNTLAMARVKYTTQQFNILGKDYVSASSENLFQVHPYKAGYTYTWSYSDPNVFTSISPTTDSITYFFKSNAQSGLITCVIKNLAGATVKTISKPIIVTTGVSLAEQLATDQCGVSQTNCGNSFINGFRLSGFSNLLSKNTNCSATGYLDVTSSGVYDSLTIGQTYQANLQCAGSGLGVTYYAGVWIDFDNNGKMDKSTEYVGAGYSNTPAVDVNNIQIPADASVGPKRMRVRVRTSGPFIGNEFCPTNDEDAETEDYLVVLEEFQGIKTPNFITPNNDGKNDFFTIRGLKSGLNNNLKIFNRVGDLVFESNDYDNMWAGTDTQGGQLKPGTYYYVFTQESTTSKSKDDVVKGFIELRY